VKDLINKTVSVDDANRFSCERNHRERFLNAADEKGKTLRTARVGDVER
jgi:hypothetical protein